MDDVVVEHSRDLEVIRGRPIRVQRYLAVAQLLRRERPRTADS